MKALILLLLSVPSFADEYIPIVRLEDLPIEQPLKPKKRKGPPREEVSALLKAYFETLREEPVCLDEGVHHVSPDEAKRAAAVLRAYLEERS